MQKFCDVLTVKFSLASGNWQKLKGQNKLGSTLVHQLLHPVIECGTSDQSQYRILRQPT